MLVDDIGDVTISNDGATILKLLEVEHPAAKVTTCVGGWYAGYDYLDEVADSSSQAARKYHAPGPIRA